MGLSPMVSLEFQLNVVWKTVGGVDHSSRFPLPLVQTMVDV